MKKTKLSLYTMLLWIARNDVAYNPADVLTQLLRGERFRMTVDGRSRWTTITSVVSAGFAGMSVHVLIGAEKIHRIIDIKDLPTSFANRMITKFVKSR